MATITVIPQGTYPEGVRSFGPANVPAGASKVILSIDRTNWLDPNVSLTISLDISLDGGVSWNPHPEGDPFPVSAGSLGGSIVDRHGNPVLTTTISTIIPDQANLNRRFRGTLEIAGGPLTTSGSLTVT